MRSETEDIRRNPECFICVRPEDFQSYGSATALQTPQVIESYSSRQLKKVTRVKTPEAFLRHVHDLLVRLHHLLNRHAGQYLRCLT